MADIEVPATIKLATRSSTSSFEKYKLLEPCVKLSVVFVPSLVSKRASV